MSTTTVILIVVVVILVLVLIGLGLAMASRRKNEQRRGQAEEMRAEAAGKVGEVQHHQLAAQEAEAQAQAQAAAAERADREAAAARRDADIEKAGHEDTIRAADELDPDVDHTAGDYRPASDGAPGQEGQPPVARPDDSEATPGQDPAR